MKHLNVSKQIHKCFMVRCPARAGPRTIARDLAERACELCKGPLREKVAEGRMRGLEFSSAQRRVELPRPLIRPCGAPSPAREREGRRAAGIAVPCSAAVGAIRSRSLHPTAHRHPAKLASPPAFRHDGA